MKKSNPQKSTRASKTFPFKVETTAGVDRIEGVLCVLLDWWIE